MAVTGVLTQKYLQHSITFSREGYEFFDFKLADVLDNFSNPALYAFVLKNMGLSFGELYRDLNKKAFIKQAQRYIPDLTLDMVEPSYAGVMSQVFEVRHKPCAWLNYTFLR